MISQKEKEALILYKISYREIKFINLMMLLDPTKEITSIVEEAMSLETGNPCSMTLANGEEYTIKKKEAKKIIVELIERHEFFDSEFTDVCTLLEQDGDLLKYVPAEQQTLERIRASVKNRNSAIRCVANKTFEALKASLQVSKTSSTYLQEKDFESLSDPELMELMDVYPDIFARFPEERYTREIVTKYLELMVSRELNPCIDYSVHIPEELKDKTYWRSLCMREGYFYSLIPEEKKHEYIIPKLIQYTLEKGNMGNSSACWMMSSIPDDLLTWDICTELCRHNPYAAGSLPKKYRTPEFYDHLIEAGCCQAIEHIDFKTATTENLTRAFSQCDNLLLCDKKIPANLWTEELALSIARCYDRIEIIPKKWRTRRVLEVFVAHHGCNIASLDKKDVDVALCILAMKSNSYAALKYIPKECLTPEFYQQCMEEDCIYIEDLPEEYRTDAFVKKAIELDHFRNLEKIPEKWLTEENLLLLLDHLTVDIPAKYQTKKVVEKYLSRPYRYNYWNETFFRLKKVVPELRPPELLTALASKYRDAISLLTTKEDIDISIAHFKQNILFAPEWYVKAYIRKEDSTQDLSEDTHEDTKQAVEQEIEVLETQKTDDDMMKNEDSGSSEPVFKQMTIWDIISA